MPHIRSLPQCVPPPLKGGKSDMMCSARQLRHHVYPSSWVDSENGYTWGFPEVTDTFLGSHILGSTSGSPYLGYHMPI